MSELLHTALIGLPPPRIGKVREVYELGNELLIIATDRISAFDVIMANGIPEKGAILTQLSKFWFNQLKGVVPNHFISTDQVEIEKRLGSAHPELLGRTTLAKRAKVIPFECVVRGYLAGSLYKEYRKSGSALYGINLPDGLTDGSKLPEPIFTPATKAESGHDENISFEVMANELGQEKSELLRKKSIELYQAASQIAERAGIILADTKFEFGDTSEGTILIDEVLTPDSSRFWPADMYQPGKPQPSYDKQYVRDYLETLNWNKQPPGPTLPAEVVQETRKKYLEAYQRLTGEPFTQNA